MYKLLVIGFKLVAGAIASNAFTGVAIGVGFIFASLVYSISRNPSQRDELLRFSFIGFSLVEASGLIGLVMSFILLFGLVTTVVITVSLFIPSSISSNYCYYNIVNR